VTDQPRDDLPRASNRRTDPPDAVAAGPSPVPPVPTDGPPPAVHIADDETPAPSADAPAPLPDLAELEAARIATGGDDDAGAPPWDLSFEPWRRSLAPRDDPPAEGVSFAEVPVRAVAYAIDIVVVQFVADLFLRFTNFLAQHTVAAGTSPDPYRIAILGVLIPLLVVVFAQAAVVTYLWEVYRASPGQMALGVFTLRAKDGRAIGGGGALARWMCLFLPVIVFVYAPQIAFILQYAVFGGDPSFDTAIAQAAAMILPMLWFLILIVSVLLDGRGRGLHDRLAGSVVVRREGSPS
jgi:hypothetical protein